MALILIGRKTKYMLINFVSDMVLFVHTALSNMISERKEINAYFHIWKNISTYGNDWGKYKHLIKTNEIRWKCVS